MLNDLSSATTGDFSSFCLLNSHAGVRVHWHRTQIPGDFSILIHTFSDMLMRQILRICPDFPDRGLVLDRQAVQLASTEHVLSKSAVSGPGDQLSVSQNNSQIPLPKDLWPKCFSFSTCKVSGIEWIIQWWKSSSKKKKAESSTEWDVEIYFHPFLNWTRLFSSGILYLSQRKVQCFHTGYHPNMFKESLWTWCSG